MRKRRTIYFNDARHYYFFVFEPPMSLEDAWRPVDEVAGTGVDTLVFGVARGDGMFYDTRVGKRFGVDARPFLQNNHWRTYANMQSLIDRGLDPLAVVIDRAHEKGIDFFASLRMSNFRTRHPEWALSNGGAGLAGPEAREHTFALLEELATRYDVEGVELDFAAAPGGMDFWLRPEDVAEYTPTITELVRRVANMVRGRPDRAGEIGARVYPTEAMNLAQGLDVKAWLREGLVDYVVPLLYIYSDIDADMPIDWLIGASHDAEVSTYGMLQHYVHSPATGSDARIYPTPEIVRAAAANLWDMGVDGLYTWAMHWPLGNVERSILSELNDPDLVRRGDKRYVLRRRSQVADEQGYGAILPLEIRFADVGRPHEVPFYFSDDLEAAADRVSRVALRINIHNTVSADRFAVLINGESLAEEKCTRRYADQGITMWLEFALDYVRPKKGRNVLQITLEERPAGLVGDVTVEEVEIDVEYGPYPTGLR